MNDGKKIEKIVRLIHEALKDIPNTKIYPNYKIKNIGGQKREIDVLIESDINGFNLKIAIECKDYKKPVPVKEIEAFNSKCVRIKGISKKVFVSSSGYQSDAIKAANDFEILLYHIDELSIKNIFDWFSIKELITKVNLIIPLNISIIGDAKTAKSIDSKEKIIIYKNGNEEAIDMIDFVWNIMVKEKINEIRNYLLLEFIKRKENEPIEKRTKIPFALSLEGVYTLGDNGEKIRIVKIESSIQTWLEEKPANIIEAFSYKDNNGVVEANTLTLNVGEKEKADLIITKDNKYSFFHTDSLGNIMQMKTLAKYDPKTDKLEIIDDDKKNED